MCLFAHLAIRQNFGVLSRMVNARWRSDLTDHDLRTMAIRALEEERNFNRKAGLGQASDRLPEFFYEEVNPSSGTVFDIPPEELDKIEYQ